MCFTKALYDVFDEEADGNDDLDQAEEPSSPRLEFCYKVGLLIAERGALLLVKQVFSRSRYEKKSCFIVFWLLL